MRSSLISSSSSSSSSPIVAARNKKPDQQKASEQAPPRITSNVKQNLQFLKLWREFQKQKSNTPKPATSYRKKKVVKEELPQDTELYEDPTNLYYTNQGLDTAIPVLLVDGYNVCGYWAKLKKHFMKGRLDIARQKLIDELITFSILKEVKVVVVFDAMMSGLPTHKENFAGCAWHAPIFGCEMLILSRTLRRLKKDLSHLNKRYFSGISNQVIECKAQLDAIQHKLQFDHCNRDSVQKKKSLNAKYSNLVVAESLFYHQRAKLDWLAQVDQNTA